MKGAWGCLAIALIALTVSLGAQSAPPAGTGQAPNPAEPATQAPQPETPPQPATPPPPRLSPEQHLANAEKALAAVSDPSAPRQMQKALAQLRADFTTMAASYRESIAKSKPWVSSIYDVERDLVLLIGGGGTDADAPEQKSIPGLAAQVSDSTTRSGLEAFRTHIELFFDAATALPPSAPASSVEGGTR